MDGATRRAGAIAGILGPRNPVQAARTVMERSGHVFPRRPRCPRLPPRQGVPLEPDALTSNRQTVDARSDEFLAKSGAETDDFNRHGTVGAVALDASATSRPQPAPAA